MVIDIKTLDTELKSYIGDVNKHIPIDKVYLFGSYAKGTPNEWSDVDVGIFSKYFENKKTVDMSIELM
jgi:predicted nucleotidyltransferase